MRKLLAVLAMVAMGGCGGGPRVVSAPASASALDCAMGEALKLGYSPLNGGLSSGYVVVRSVLGATAGDVAKDATKRVLTLGLKGADRTAMDDLTMSFASGTRRTMAVGREANGNAREPSDIAKTQSDAILKACSTP